MAMYAACRVWSCRIDLVVENQMYDSPSDRQTRAVVRNPWQARRRLGGLDSALNCVHLRLTLFCRDWQWRGPRSRVKGPPLGQTCSTASASLTGVRGPNTVPYLGFHFGYC